jgi:HD-GYP domain-containing protein (c-di-GMP phosphodiesterase class II)
MDSTADSTLAIEQALRYAEELQGLYKAERTQRRAAERALLQLQDSYTTTVRALATALELRDDQTGGHAERVTSLALALAERIDPALAAESQLKYGFLLHDLGKIGIRDAVLLKPGALTPDEFEEMRFHVVLGERILAGIPYLSGLARDVVAAHHERWDGAGYPRGLGGTDIPLAARIFAVVDAFDAMTSDRPYRPALDVEYAVGEIAAQGGAQFDPSVATTFVAMAPQLRRGRIEERVPGNASVLS